MPRPTYSIMTKGELISVYFSNYDGVWPSQLKETNPGLYAVLKQKNLINIMATKLKWARMSDKELVDYYQKNFPGKTSREVEAKGLVCRFRKRGLLDFMHKKRKPTGYWSKKSDKELLEIYNRDHRGWSYTRMNKEAGGFLQQLVKRGLFQKQNVRWSEMSDKQLLDVYKEKYDGLTPSELRQKTDKLYRELLERKLMHNLPKKVTEKGFYSDMTDPQLSAYYKGHFYGVGQRELHKKAPGLQAEIYRRGLSYIFPKTIENLEQVVGKDRAAKRLLQITAGNGHFLDAVNVLNEIYPTISLASRNGKRLESLKEYLGNFVIDSKMLGTTFAFLARGLPQKALESRQLEDLLFRIARDTWQKDFNSRPKAALDEIGKQACGAKHPYVQKILGKVQDFYSSVMELEIPGVTA